MLKLSKLTDYAVVAVSHLWQAAPMQKTAGDLALETLLPEPTLVKVLKQLARAGVVQSKRGIGGGYFVSKAAGHEISVWQIIEAIEGPVALTTCVDGEALDDCCIRGTCPLQGRWLKVNNAICDALDNITLADMQNDKLKKVIAHG